MDILQKAKDAVALIAQGRAALAEVVDTIRDAKAAVSTHSVVAIDALLEQERVENRATNEAVTDAIADFRSRHP